MIHHGDLFDVLPTLADHSIDACVTDPPYGIGFMGKKWDTFKPGATAAKVVANTEIESDNPNLKNRVRRPATSPSSVEYDRSLAGQREFQAWTESWARFVWPVLKPGAHLLVCGAPRSYHRMASGLEDAGFEVRDCLAWIFGQGFPKSLNFPDGWGTALKPAYEPIIVARKPLTGTVKANRERFGTGAINIESCRLGDNVRLNGSASENRIYGQFKGDETEGRVAIGRWPANVAFDESAAAMLDEQSGELVSGDWTELNRNSDKFRNAYAAFKGERVEHGRHSDSGGASRFFYVAKPSREERDIGCHDLHPRQRDDSRKEGNPGGDNPRNRGLQPRGNHHPTVKPIELMRWLVRLVTPVGGTVLDPFTGSGTTGCACAFELFNFIGIEREAEYVEIAKRRIASCAPLFTETA